MHASSCAGDSVLARAGGAVGRWGGQGQGRIRHEGKPERFSFPCLQLWACKCSYTSDYAFRDALRPIWVVALQDFTAGSVLISEPPLVGIQHNSNRTAALVCSHCFRYLGSVETQIGVRLAALQGEGELQQCAQIQRVNVHSGICASYGR